MSLKQWEDWIERNKVNLEHEADFEERFVREILTKIPEISPKNVTSQYLFKDQSNVKRYIDFFISDPSRGIKIAIELDGKSKIKNMDDWVNLFVRQNALVSNVDGLLLRFANVYWLHNDRLVIAEIRFSISKQEHDFKSQQLKEQARDENKDQEKKQLEVIEALSTKMTALEQELKNLTEQKEKNTTQEIQKQTENTRKSIETLTLKMDSIANVLNELSKKGERAVDHSSEEELKTARIIIEEIASKINAIEGGLNSFNHENSINSSEEKAQETKSRETMNSLLVKINGLEKELQDLNQKQFEQRPLNLEDKEKTSEALKIIVSKISHLENDLREISAIQHLTEPQTFGTSSSEGASHRYDSLAEERDRGTRPLDPPEELPSRSSVSKRNENKISLKYLISAICAFFVIVTGLFYLFGEQTKEPKKGINISEVSSNNLTKSINFVNSKSIENFAGKEVKFCGVLKEIRPTRKLTYLNFDHTYPENKVAAVIFDEDAFKFSDITQNIGKEACIEGTVEELNKNKFLIKLRSKEQWKK